MNPSITVCIPTYLRPDLLQQALASVAAQRVPPTEVIVSDNDSAGSAAACVETFSREVAFPVRYLINDHGRGLASNVNHLIQATHTEWLVLLHDDDRLLPEALEAYASHLNEADLVAAYGLQEWMDYEGRTDATRTQDLNHCFARGPEQAGLQADALEAAWRQQFPNDGYLVRTAAARRVGGLDPAYGNAAEVVLGLRLAACGRFRLIPRPLCQYRDGGPSLGRSSSDDSALQFIRLVEDHWGQHDGRYDNLLLEVSRTRVGAAIMQAWTLSRPQLARRWFWSRLHRPFWFTPGAYGGLSESTSRTHDPASVPEPGNLPGV